MGLIIHAVSILMGISYLHDSFRDSSLLWPNSEAGHFDSPRLRVLGVGTNSDL